MGLRGGKGGRGRSWKNFVPSLFAVKHGVCTDRAFWLGKVSFRQINKMRQHVARGGRNQLGGCRGIDAPGQLGCSAGGGGEGGQNLALALAAVGDQLPQAGRGIIDAFAVTGQHLLPDLRQKPVQ